jgi:hypothetical protein
MNAASADGKLTAVTPQQTSRGSTNPVASRRVSKDKANVRLMVTAAMVTIPIFSKTWFTLSATGTQLGYARVSTGHQSLDQQVDALTAAGVDTARVYSDKLSGTSTREQSPGLAALLDDAREGDAIVVVGIDRLGRNAAPRPQDRSMSVLRRPIPRRCPEGTKHTTVSTGACISGGSTGN